MKQKPPPPPLPPLSISQIVIEKTATALQPYILKVVQFYVQSKDATAELAEPTEEVTTLFHRFYDVVYELHQVSPDLLLPVCATAMMMLVAMVVAVMTMVVAVVMVMNNKKKF